MRTRYNIQPNDRMNHPPRTKANTTIPGNNRHKTANEIAEIYADMAAKADRWAWLDHLFPGPLRRRQFGDVDGRLLDVACGTGRNFRYFPESVDFVGIDISEDMLAKARNNLHDLEIDGTLHRMDAQALDFPDNSFDTVVSAFSTCTFPDPVAALHEMARVCAPDGRIFLLEHGQSSVGPIARVLDWRADTHYEKAGCRLNQEPLEVLNEAGLPVLEARKSLFGMVTAIEAAPEGTSNSDSATER